MAALPDAQLESLFADRVGAIAVAVPGGVVVHVPSTGGTEPGGAVRYEDAPGRWVGVAGPKGAWFQGGTGPGGAVWFWDQPGRRFASLDAHAWSVEVPAARDAGDTTQAAVACSGDGPIALGRACHRWIDDAWAALPDVPAELPEVARALCLPDDGGLLALGAGPNGWAAARLDFGASEWRVMEGTPVALSWPSLTLMRDGTVLLLSGPANPPPGVRDRGAWRYDPAADTWTGVVDPPMPLQSHAVVPLTDGRLLVDASAGAAVFDSVSLSWEPFPSVSERIGSGAVAPLSRNRILRVGGINLRPVWEIIDCSREAVAAAQRAEETGS